MSPTHRECSQERLAMGVHEVASLPGGTGSPMGPKRRRASPFLAKSDQSASFETVGTGECAVCVRSSAWVLHAITFSTRNVPLTDEVPWRPGLGGRVRVGYKSHTKGLPHASEAGTDSLRPRPWGWQQRRSRGVCGRLAARAYSERQNLRVSGLPTRGMRPVSPGTQTTKWSGGTSSRQLPGPLRNSLQHPRPVHPTVHPR
jgi:hypothetical protein